MTDLKYEYYQNLHKCYFERHINVNDLVKELQRILPISVEKNFSLPDEPIMIISNHPILEENSGLSTKKLGNLKGFNYLNTNTLWFPSIRESLLQYALKIPFVTIIRPIGYDIATDELGCLCLEGSNGVNQIINFLNKEDNLSCLLYPEGGFNKLDTCFRRGFYFIAKRRNYRYLLKLIIDPILGLNLRNNIIFAELELIPSLTTSKEIQEFVIQTKDWYKSHTYYLYKQFNLI